MKSLYIFMILICLSPALDAKNSSLSKKDPYWDTKLDDHTKHYSFKTYKQFFADKVKTAVDESTFTQRLTKAKISFVTPAQLLAMNIGNERLERYWDKKTPEEMYPLGDRPRGQQDIKIIYDLMKTTKPVSPVVLGRVLFKDGFEQIIVLDGMHRILAAHLLDKPLAVIIVDVR